MRILTGYLLRAHLGPFLFALIALESLLFLNAIAQRLQDLAGKGLGWDVVTEFMTLSLPHTVALTMPMAVLVAVLYAFTELAANNEITAMKAGGVRPQRLLAPLILLGTAVSLLMFVFNDRVLPESNHKLKTLLMDIGRKTPTFSLREQAVNAIPTLETGQSVFLLASRIDNASNTLYDVEIVNPTQPNALQITVADSAEMHFNEARTDLYLTLYDGVMHESGDDPLPGTYHQVRFSKQIVPLRGVGNQPDRQMGGASRTEREMPISMLETYAARQDSSIAALERASGQRSLDLVRFALGYPVEGEDFVAVPFDGPTAAFPSPAVGPGVDGAPAPAPVLVRDHVLRRNAYIQRSYPIQVASMKRLAANYRVEIHKKYALAAACLVFVLIGAPLAVRFPRGGLGLVIAASSVIFGVYWVGLIGGENLADAGRAPPWLGMWIANVIFGLIGVVLVARMGHESASTRGGGWDELLFAVREALASPFRRRGRARARREAAAG